MSPPRTSLRQAIDELSRQFADAVLRAIRAAPLEELGAPAASREPRARPAEPRAPSKPRRAPRPRAVAARPLPREQAPESSIITDPQAMLEALERSEPRRPAAPHRPELRTAPPPPPLSREVTPAAREGEQVLRTSEGGVVIRRGRGAPGARSQHRA